MDEALFIKGIQLGDRKAFQTLGETYQQMVVNTCLAIVHNKADAEDLAQDVFLEIFRTAENFRGDAKISTWLYRIASNRSLNLIRNNKSTRFFQPIEEPFQNGRIHSI